MRILLKLLVVFCMGNPVVAQNGWKVLNVPVASRYDDVFFLDETRGWIAASNGSIFKTTDGGTNWALQYNAGKHLRSIEFSSASTGFCGSLDSGFFKTTNGGVTWTDIRNVFNPVLPGICGLSAPDSLHVYGCGAWYSPAYFIKSTNGGVTWTQKDMSAYASALVDILFLDNERGFVSGKAIGRADGGIILYTKDGGNTWEVVKKTMIPNDYVWKLQTPDKKNLFASIQGSGNTFIRFLSSGDVGLNWATTVVKPYNRYIQAVGFIDPLHGWLGGDTVLFKTNDGGETWSENIAVGSSYNRFFRINSKIAFLTGKQLYKYNALQDASLPLGTLDEVHSIELYPNPSTGPLKIQVVFGNPTYAKLEIFSADGSMALPVLNERVQGDSRSFSVDVSGLGAGTYFVSLRTNEGVITRKLVKQ
jgi:photosystem II stability/assembly factor-like uncharacterized protein